MCMSSAWQEHQQGTNAISLQIFLTGVRGTSHAVVAVDDFSFTSFSYKNCPSLPEPPMATTPSGPQVIEQILLLENFCCFNYLPKKSIIDIKRENTGAWLWLHIYIYKWTHYHQGLFDINLVGSGAPNRQSKVQSVCFPWQKYCNFQIAVESIYRQ